MSGTVIIIPSSNKKDEPVNTDILCNGIASSSSLVSTSFSYAQPSSILMDVLDSTYCDTIYAVAQNKESNPLKDIPVLFTINQDDQDTFASIGSSPVTINVIAGYEMEDY